MTELKVKSGIPFLTASLIYQDTIIAIENVLLDTGLATTIFSADLIEGFGIVPDHNDEIHRMGGIGGYEYVIKKNIDGLRIGEKIIEQVSIQLGDMDYGFNISGILGYDALSRMGSVIDLSNNLISFID